MISITEHRRIDLDAKIAISETSSFRSGSVGGNRPTYPKLPPHRIGSETSHRSLSKGKAIRSRKESLIGKKPPRSEGKDGSDAGSVWSYFSTYTAEDELRMVGDHNGVLVPRQQEHGISHVRGCLPIGPFLIGTKSARHDDW